MDSRKEPIISIVTICYNCKKELEYTIKQVLEQTYNNIEHIIIDGGSSDGTKELIQEYSVFYKSKSLKWISEKDSGISDAFNKGTNIAGGDFIHYLNSGDGFAKKDTLNEIIKNGLINKNQINCFDTIIKDKEIEIYSKASVELEELLWRNSICHQSVILDIKLAKKYPYDTRLKLEMEYDIWFKMYKQKEIFNYINKPLAKYSLGGISEKNIILCQVLHFMVACINLNELINFKNFMKILNRLVKLLIREKLKNILKEKIRWIRKIKYLLKDSIYES